VSFLQEGDIIQTFEVRIKQQSLEEASGSLGAAAAEKALDKAEEKERLAAAV
jgi:hypothetical protein